MKNKYPFVFFYGSCALSHRTYIIHHAFGKLQEIFANIVDNIL